METIKEKFVKARKDHTCDYCGKVIHKGEKYHYSFIKNGGDTYEWITHEKCEFVAQAIYDYCDPWEGLTSDYFLETCDEMLGTFVCPDCAKEKGINASKCASRKCIDKLYEFFQKYELYRYYDEYGIYRGWKVREKK